MSKTAYPLSWPLGRPRTVSYRVATSRFDTSFTSARNNLVAELDRLGARNAILSTNIELRLDGLPYANRAEPTDRGVAVYFEHKGRAMAFACDRWNRVGDNIHAIALTIGALRGISRWGTGDMMEAAFTGFAALPPPSATGRGWRTVLGFAEGERPDLETVDARFRKRAFEVHPDRGGTHEAQIELNAARDQARKELT